MSSSSSSSSENRSPSISTSSPQAYLSSLLNKQLLVHTTDNRMFAGNFKCTDNERNIILAMAHEYRHPTPAAIEAAAMEKAGQEGGSVKVGMTSRFMGLVVVPGQHITKIEVEE